MKSLCNLLQLKSLRHDILPECGPSEVKMYCSQVRMSNTAYRAGENLGTIDGVDFTEWIMSNLIRPDAGIDRAVHEYICQRATRRPCPTSQ